MKKAILFLFILISVGATAQTSTSGKAAVDSTEIKKTIEANKIVTSIVSQTPVQVFQQWLYKKMSAEKYDEFVRYYNLFIEELYKEKNKKP